MLAKYIVLDFIERRSIRIEFREPLDVRDVHDRRIYVVEIDRGKERPIDGLDGTWATLAAAQAAYRAHTGPKVALSPTPTRRL